MQESSIDETAQQVTLPLSEAERLLYQAGRADGIGSTVKMFKEALGTICQRHSSVRDAYAPFFDEINQLNEQVHNQAVDYQAECQRYLTGAVKAGLGADRRTLRERVRDAILGAVAGWRCPDVSQDSHRRKGDQT